MKLINYLQQTLPHSYIPYTELKNVIKKLQARLATFSCFNQIYKTYNCLYTYIASSNHISVITMGEPLVLLK